MKRVEVAVVGAGAAGLIASREALRLGLEVEVFEEDETIGRPERCAGLYSIHGLKRLGIELRDDYVQNTVKGAIIHSPGGNVIDIRTNQPVAAVIRREALDRYLAEEAILRGAKINIHSRVKYVQKEGRELKLRIGEDEVAASALIDAEGHSGIIAKMLFPSYRTTGWIPIIQLLISGHRYEEDIVHIWFKQYLRDFFGYLIPIDDKLGRLGVASYKDTLTKVRKFLEEVAPQAKIIGYSSSCIYEGLPSEVGLDGNAVLVGNVAGQVKPTTGGGVVIGGICAQYAAQHIYNLLREGKDGTYRRRVEPIYRELRMMHRIKNWIKSLSDEKLDQLFREILRSGFDKKIASAGDMDFQATSTLKALFSINGVKLIFRLIMTGLLPG